MAARPISKTTRAAVALLGAQIAIGRRERGWQIAELAERAGVSEPTVRRAERGDPTVGIGIVLELAHLVGVPLFGGDADILRRALADRTDRLALLPERVRRPS